jgi:hypothetical protein
MADAPFRAMRWLVSVSPCLLADRRFSPRQPIASKRALLPHDQRNFDGSQKNALGWRGKRMRRTSDYCCSTWRRRG